MYQADITSDQVENGGTDFEPLKQVLVNQVLIHLQYEVLFPQTGLQTCHYNRS